jgi:HD-GYP domain-containing protein (c-di-GMP phosphodiesterase class II)
MLSEIQINSVNSNYLEKVMALTEVADVMAIEDIFDARKMKLIAKGAKLSRGMQERLIMRKLSKPLESSIAVDGGVDNEMLISEAKRIAESLEAVTCMLRTTVNKSAFCPFDVMSGIQYGHAMRTMLTITERGGAAALMHSVMVSLISVCIANNMGLDRKTKMTAAVAGILHDIGELYVDPKYVNSKTRLQPHEWRHVVVHPRIGQMLISELERYPEDVARAVFEHHERYDGAGYPRKLVGNNISTVGQIVAVAEMISGIFADDDRSIERAELALKIFPGEYASGLVTAICGSLRAGRTEHKVMPDISIDETKSKICGISERISMALDSVQELLDLTVLNSPKAKDLLIFAERQIRTIRQAFRATGLYVYMDLDNTSLLEAQNLEVLFEAVFATKEIQWRLQAVARCLALQSALLDPVDAEVFQPLITLLDQRN